MSTPDITALDNALLTSLRCLDDRTLKSSELTLDWWSGQPWHIIGDASVVYQLSTRKKSYAVKCFTREDHDRIEHYKQLARYFYARTSDLFVEWEFLPRGIEIGKRRYPVLKMPWVPGKTLRAYVADNILRSNILLDLAEQLVRASSQLQDLGFVHRSVHPDNIIVTNHGLKLVDLDHSLAPGVMVPIEAPLAGIFEYPYLKIGSGRAPSDNFAFQLLHTTLISLAFQPELLQSNEALLFSEKDFEDTAASQVFQLLLNHPHSRVRESCRCLEAALCLPPDQIPSLLPENAEQASPPASLPQWLKDELAGRLAHSVPAPAAGRPGLPALGELPAKNASAFDYRSTLGEQLPSLPALLQAERVKTRWLTPGVAKISILASVVLMACSLICPVLRDHVSLCILFDLALVLANFGLWNRLYVNDPEQTILRSHQDLIERRLQSLRAIEAHLKETVAQLQVDNRALESQLGAQIAQQSTIVTRIQSDIAALSGTSRQKLASLEREHQARLRVLRDLRDAEMSELQSTVGKLIQEIEHDLDTLAAQELNALEDMLRQVQKRHVENELKKCLVESSAVMGLDGSTATVLRRGGIATALDVCDEKLAAVPGVRTSVIKALINWRHFNEEQCAVTRPIFLSVADKGSATKNIDRDRSHLVRQLRKLQGNRAATSTEVGEFYQIAFAQLERIQKMSELQAQRDDEVRKCQASLDAAVASRRGLEEQFKRELQRIASLSNEVDQSRQQCESEIENLERVQTSSKPKTFQEYAMSQLSS